MVLKDENLGHRILRKVCARRSLKSMNRNGTPSRDDATGEELLRSARPLIFY
jgi:hypothetical protein